MKVEALISYLAAWLKELIKGIMQTFGWLENLGTMLDETTTNKSAE